MKKELLFICLLFSVASIFGQTTILDFEEAGTSTTFQYFGNGALSDGPNMNVANPDASGINTSSMVAEFIKTANSETWAGAFSNPDPTIPVNLTTATHVCIDVYMPAVGNLALKLEASSTGGPNWITTQANTTTNQWEQLCFDVTAPSIEDPLAPANGHTYARVVLFFDFGANSPDEAIYYFDNLVVVEGEATEEDVTFSVDMNDYADPFTQVYVSGSFNGWNGESNPLSDDDMDGVWTGTYPLLTGAYEFKYTLDNWAVQETFAGGEECTITTDGFTNRTLTVTGPTELATNCFNSCYACGDGVSITVNVGTSHITVAESGLYIAGGGNFGAPGDFPLLDPDEDGVYSITFTKQSGFSSFYTFTNGACGDFSCKENIAGQECANPDNFNDRMMGPITQDTVINTCFGMCTDHTDCGGFMGGNITFQVDMTGYADPFTTVYVSGSFNGWNGEANPMTDADADGIWEATLELPAGSHQYKFTLDNWAVQEEFAGGEPCTVMDGDFVNRGLDVSGDATFCYLWNSCTTCSVNTSNLTVVDNIFSVQPTLVRDFTTLVFSNEYGAEKELHLVNALGQVMESREIAAGMTNYSADLSQIPAGLYFFHVTTAGKQQIQRVVVSH